MQSHYFEELKLEREEMRIERDKLNVWKNTRRKG
jgi:hypothetical protein